MLAQLALMLVIAVVSGAVGYWLAHRRRRLLGPLVAFGVVVLGVSVVPRLFPTEFYFLFPVSRFGETALASAFLLTGALAGAYRDTAFRIILQVILAPLMVYFVLGSTAYLAVRGDYIRGLHYRVVDGVTLQSDNFGCVPSSLATVLRTFGLEHTEGELGYALHTTPMGTDFIRIPGVVEEFGVAADLGAEFVRPTLAQLRALGRPAVLMVYAGRIRHAVALLGFSGTDMLIGEPLVGMVRIPESEFRSRTRWTGLAVVISPREAADRSGKGVTVQG